MYLHFLRSIFAKSVLIDDRRLIDRLETTWFGGFLGLDNIIIYAILHCPGRCRQALKILAIATIPFLGKVFRRRLSIWSHFGNFPSFNCFISLTTSVEIIYFNGRLICCALSRLCFILVSCSGFDSGNG